MTFALRPRTQRTHGEQRVGSTGKQSLSRSGECSIAGGQGYGRLGGRVGGRGEVGGGGGGGGGEGI